MATFGYDSTVGWLPATYPLLLVDLQDKYIAQTSENVDVTNGPAADMLRTVASMFKDAYDDALGAYTSSYISAAPGTNGVSEGSSLELLLTPKIGPKLAAAASTVTLTLNGDPATVIPTNSALVIAGETVTWKLLGSPVVLDGGGTIDAEFTYDETGPKTAIASSTWTITTPVTGWDTATNAADAIPGRNVETDAEYRDRYLAALASDIIGAVRGVSGVTAAWLVEWDSSEPDSYWGLTHWFEVIVAGGDDEEVALAIQSTRAKGTRTVGTTDVVIADDDYVDGQFTIRISRPELVALYIEVTITQGEGYPDDDSVEAIKAREAVYRTAIVDYVGALQPGNNTSGYKVGAQLDELFTGIDDVTVKVDIVSPPVNTGTLAADIREQFTIVTPASDVGIVGA